MMAEIGKTYRRLFSQREVSCLLAKALMAERGIVGEENQGIEINTIYMQDGGKMKQVRTGVIVKEVD